MELYNHLKAWRKLWAEKHDVPAFVVFSNKSLEELCVRLPRDKEELLTIQGLGPQKVENFGEELLQEISSLIG